MIGRFPKPPVPGAKSRLTRREDMTLCMAAVAQDEAQKNQVCYCADMRTETHSSGSETIYKMRKVGDQFNALFAGTVARATEVMDLYTTYLADKKLTRLTALEELRKPPQQVKRRLVEEYVQNTLAISYDVFLSNGSTSLPAALFDSMSTEISRLEIGCQILLTPIPKTQITSLYTVDVNGAVFEEQNFAAIGSGASSAMAWLHYRQQSRFLNVNQTLFHLWEAKKFSENAPGVGKETKIAWIDNDNKLRSLLKTKEEAFEKAGKRFGPRNTKRFSVDLKSSFSVPVEWQNVGT